MGDHLVLCVDRLITPESLQSMQEAEAAGSSGEGSSQGAEPHSCAVDVKDMEEHVSCDEEEPLIQTVECRICQDEDSTKNLETPCACSGSLKVFIFWSILTLNSFLLHFMYAFSFKNFQLPLAISTIIFRLCGKIFVSYVECHHDVEKGRDGFFFLLYS